MNTRAEPRYLEWPQVVPLSQDEQEKFRATCEAIAAKGGETGEIARDMLHANEKLTAMINKIDAFLKR